MINIELTNLLQQLPGYIGWKDTHFRHIGCNDNLARVLKFTHPDQIISLIDADLPGNTEELSLYHKHNDELALAGQTIKAIHKSSFPYDGSLFCFVKKPLVDSLNQICGILYHCQEFAPNEFIINLLETDMRYSSLANQYHLTASSNIRELSPKELECLFCTLRGLNARETAISLGLSKRTVESYLENIKNKFGSTTKQEMIMMATLEGYRNIIPEKLLINGKKLFN